MSTADVARALSLVQPKLRAYIRSLVYNPSDVDDILQNVAVAAIENADKCDPNRSIDAWVFGIAKNKVLKYLERSKRQKLTFSTEVVEALTESASNEDNQAELLESLQSCLDKLDNDKRDMLVRRHRSGVTAREIAREFGYSDSKISRMLNGLYASLMKCMQRQLAWEG
ncbi:sigma-70 family RNA polymerase sigma factor [Bremerella sp. P1]|uniref:sigma-70 family RNA polymerase sigma factor n=1 Tax=Bremerella sp. P1 TaxID=3026424 RepID=UPI002368E86E|nr:sigma-70 family RNA polymerase sigma factor [Bremerella sp. P1]WDI43826.1 sigma-70 family RNA polymerase sigma factor [Bremerella sp. P1]